MSKEISDSFSYLLANLDKYKEFAVSIEADPTDPDAVIVAVNHNGESVDRFEAYPVVASLISSFFESSPLGSLAALLLKTMEANWQAELRLRTEEACST